MIILYKKTDLDVLIQDDVKYTNSNNNKLVQQIQQIQII